LSYASLVSTDLLRASAITGKFTSRIDSLRLETTRPVPVFLSAATTPPKHIMAQKSLSAFVNGYLKHLQMAMSTAKRTCR